MGKVFRFERKTNGLQKINMRDIVIGDSNFVVMAGPCAVENREQLISTAKCVKESGSHFLRGGAFKPRVSPYSFQGLGEEGLELLNEAKKETGLLIITELMDKSDFGLIDRCADIIQVGSRNMHNYSLLKFLGETQKPVMLKRGYSATIEEWLLAAEYIHIYGNSNVILCERGIRTFDNTTRFTLDLGAVALIKSFTNYPVFVDPSHGSGMRELVGPLAKAAVVVGADGLLIEVHTDPDQALSDGKQSLSCEDFSRLMDELNPICSLVGKKLM